jgi:hypothetical protein
VRLEGDQTRVYDQGRALSHAVARYGPWLEREALKLVRGNKARARRMARQALERLWEWDVTRFCPTDELYLKQALVQAMLVHQVPNRRDPCLDRVC